MIGLGRIGANVVRRLTKAARDCVVYDVDQDTAKTLESAGATGRTLDEFGAKLTKPRAPWVMVRAGEVTESAMDDLAERMEADDAATRLDWWRPS